MRTGASSGSVTTQYFGEKFDADKVETKLFYDVNVYGPASYSIRNNPNVTLHIDIEKVSLEDLLSGFDRLYSVTGTLETSHRSYNYTPPEFDEYHIMHIDREVIPADIRKQNLEMMPGFRVSWHYSGIEVDSEDQYRHNAFRLAFVRNYSNNIF